MEALLVEQLPDGEGWQYEPKWDGFRCLAVRDGASGAVVKSGKPLGRYFPESLAMFCAAQDEAFISTAVADRAPTAQYRSTRSRRGFIPPPAVSQT